MIKNIKRLINTLLCKISGFDAGRFTETYIDNKDKSSLEPASSLSFHVMNNGQIYIGFGFSNTTEHNKVLASQLLFALNDGILENAIKENIIKNTPMDNINHISFVKGVIENWEKEKDKRDNEPIITPTRALALGKVVRATNGEENIDLDEDL